MKITDKEGTIEFKRIPLEIVGTKYQRLYDIADFVKRSNFIPLIGCRMAWYCDRTEVEVSFPLSFN